MGFSGAVMLYVLAYHAYGPRPKNASAFENHLWELACRGRIDALKALAWTVWGALYPRPQRRARNVVGELAYHAMMLAAGGGLGALSVTLGALIKRADPMRDFVPPPCKPRYTGPDAETLWREVTERARNR